MENILVNAKILYSFEIRKRKFNWIAFIKKLNLIIKSKLIVWINWDFKKK